MGKPCPPESALVSRNTHAQRHGGGPWTPAAGGITRDLGGSSCRLSEPPVERIGLDPFHFLTHCCSAGRLHRADPVVPVAARRRAAAVIVFAISIILIVATLLLDQVKAPTLDHLLGLNIQASESPTRFVILGRGCRGNRAAAGNAGDVDALGC